MRPLGGHTHQWSVVWVVLLSLLLSLPVNVAAAPQNADAYVVHGIEQRDLDGDGSLDLTIIAASFNTERDQVWVYDGSGDMISSDEWQRATDFDDDTWVFDIGADGTAQLIVAFDQVEGRSAAYLYDDRDGDGQVAYRASAGQLEVDESDFWTVKMEADGAWCNTDGSINRNVWLSVDGPLGERGLDFEYVLDAQLNDGRVDVEMECHTGAWSEMSAYCLTRSFSTFWGIGRTKVRVAVPGYELPEIRGYVFWPHLGPGLSEPRPPQEIAPALSMNWTDARFHRSKGINNLVQWVGPEAGWWVFSPEAVVKGEDNVVGFENPFAHYDLASNRDGWAELVIRHVYTPPDRVWYSLGDIYKQSQDPRHRLQLVRYTWDQDSDDCWDYKLGLIGRNSMDTIVSFPDFGMTSIPYQQLPRAVTEDMPWEGATFVQVEGFCEASPEGVYTWDDILPLSRAYMFGFPDALDADMDDIRTGFRGEYRVQQLGMPELYHSPVDHKLHLLGADAGVWNLDDRRRLRYEDLDSDGYLDQWALTVRPEGQEVDSVAEATEPAEGEPDESVAKSLQVAKGFLVYSDDEGVKVKDSNVEASAFRTMPPRSHEEWLALGQLLEENSEDWAPDDFTAMMEQFEGPATEIERASLRGFRLTDTGFRFVLELAEGFRVLTDDAGLGVRGLTTGSYVVTHDGDFHIQPLTPAHVTVAAPGIRIEPSVPQQAQWVLVTAVLRNHGEDDVSSLPLRLQAAMAGEEAQVIVEEELFLRGGEEYALVGRWWPRTAGIWTLWVDAGAYLAMPSVIEAGSLASSEVRVLPAAQPGMFHLTGVYDGMAFTWPVALLLASVALTATSLATMILVRGRDERASECTSRE
jgi:hypothetical protein